jgi:hypothetical protein
MFTFNPLFAALALKLKLIHDHSGLFIFFRNRSIISTRNRRPEKSEVKGEILPALLN